MRFHTKSVASRLLILEFMLFSSLCILAAFYFINISSAFTLVIFTFFFTSLIFQLNGTLIQKIGLLTVGNIVGLLSNVVFYYFSWVGCQFFGITFDVVYTLIYPVLNLMWIVPFWSFSMGILPAPQKESLLVKK